MEMINWLNSWLADDNTKLMYLLALILIANVIDFLIGWINAKFNSKVTFSSNTAIMGIARKIILFILLVVFIPVSLLVPYPVGMGALYTLYGGYLLSEFNSILSHLKLTKDDKTTDMFADLLGRIFSKGDKKP